MEMHQLRYVVAVARARNFSRAAEQCHVSQPSLSQRMLKLERELGERLFDRMKREVKLTPHGQAFLPRAIKILEEVDVAKREACDAQSLIARPDHRRCIADHCTVSAACRARSFREKFPGVEIVVQEDTTAQLLKLAHTYEIDFAVASRPIENQHMEVKGSIRRGSCASPSPRVIR